MSSLTAIPSTSLQVRERESSVGDLLRTPPMAPFGLAPANGQ
jgi:hypothetical protein